jgi:hypothetical protein
MRTTVTLDADVAVQLERLMKEQGLGFKEALNLVLRRGFAGKDARPRKRHRTRAFRQGMGECAPGVDAVDRDILFDPQTSGGLLVALPPENLPGFAARMGEGGSWKRVGEFTAGGACPVRVLP